MINKNETYEEVMFDNFQFTIGFTNSGSVELMDYNQRIQVKKNSRHATIDNLDKAIRKMKESLINNYYDLDCFNYIYRGCVREFVNDHLKIVKTDLHSKSGYTSSQG